MTTTDGFYVVLPSNATEGNTPSKFLTTFQSPITISNPEEWEVGLIEINFKNALKTIYKDKIEVIRKTLHYPDRRDNVELKTLISLYENPSSVSGFFLRDYSEFWTVPLKDKMILFKSDDNEIPEFYITYDRMSNRVIVVNNLSTPMHLNIPIYLAEVLGFIDLNGRTDIKYELEKYTIESIPPGRYTAKHGLYVALIRGKWSMISFPKSQKKFNLTYDIDYMNKATVKVSEKIVSVSPKSGRYLKGKDLAKELVNADFNKYFKLEYDERENLFKIISVKANEKTFMYEIAFTGGIHEVLGFKKSVYTNEEIGTGITGDLTVDLERGVTSIFVYCDLVQPIRVGNTTSPLLRPIAFNAHKYGEMVHTHFFNPMYIPINKSFIDTIEVRLCDASGEVIAFVEGLTTLILHFKRL